MVATRRIKAEAQTFRLFAPYKWLHCGVSTVSHGNMSYAAEPRDVVQPRREAFLRELGLNVSARMPSVVVPIMEHSDGMVEVPEAGMTMAPRCDVLVTRGRSVLLQTLADCLGMVFVHPQKRIVALAHAGYKGVGLEVPRKTVEYLELLYNICPRDLLVGMGPAAGDRFAEGQYMEFLGPDLQASHWDDYKWRDGDGWRVQWTDRAYDQLLRAGIPGDNIERCKLDTRHNRHYFSHSRWCANGKVDIDGRHAIAVGMAG